VADDTIEIGEISVTNYVTQDCSMNCQMSMSLCTCVQSVLH